VSRAYCATPDEGRPRNSTYGASHESPLRVPISPTTHADAGADNPTPIATVPLASSACAATATMSLPPAASPAGSDPVPFRTVACAGAASAPSTASATNVLRHMRLNTAMRRTYSGKRSVTR
jgi:hypothetical protein